MKIILAILFAVCVFSAFVYFLAEAEVTDEAMKRSEQFFARNDANKDGKLSREEIPKAQARLFDRIDTNSDGLVTLEEDVAFRRNRQRQTAQSRNRPLPKGVKVERDIVYARVGERELLLDLYFPERASQRPLPVVAWVHGGGWRGGSKGSGGPARSLVLQGFAVVDVGYRLSGEAIFPAQIEDCKAAIRWIRANAKKYNLDPDRIGAWGSSAGGHLVAMLGTTGDVKDFDTSENGEYSSSVQAVCDWFGPTDFLRMNDFPGNIDHDAAESPESLVIGGPIQENKEKAAKADPITYINGDEPPFLIMHGEKDQLVAYNQSELLYDALKKAGVETTLYCVKGGGHGFGGATEDTPEELLRMAGGFFEKHLKAERMEAADIPRLKPTFENISYGTDERNVLDFWKAESDSPTPLVIFIHGGGFINGSKDGIARGGKGNIQRCLDNGVSFAAINYRFRNTTPLTDILLDVARAVQFLRYKADEWNIDKNRVAAFGGSAGAGSSLWLAFHDDLADPDNEDPVLRESTRLTVAGATATQATYDCEQWAEIVGISPSWMTTYNFNIDLEFYHLTREEVNSPRGREIRKKLDMLSMMDPGDAPIYLFNNRPNTDPKDAGHIIHHPRHAVAIKKKCDELGIDAAMVLFETPEEEKVDMFDFFFRHLRVEQK